jgi:hypothetical protein
LAAIFFRALASAGFRAATKMLSPVLARAGVFLAAEMAVAMFGMRVTYSALSRVLAAEREARLAGAILLSSQAKGGVGQLALVWWLLWDGLVHLTLVRTAALSACGARGPSHGARRRARLFGCS